MIYDALIKTGFLTVTILIVLTIALLLSKRYAKNFKELGMQRSFDMKNIAIYIVAVPTWTFILTKLPDHIIIYTYVIVLTIAIGSSMFILTKKLYMYASGLIFPIVYFNFWNTYTFNIFAIIIAIFIILMMSQAMSWKIAKIFMILITIMDIILVFFTKTMITGAMKVIGDNIPAMVVLPRNDITISGIALGLGDMFLIGLLCVIFIREKMMNSDEGMTKTQYRSGFKFIWLTGIIIGILLFVSTLLWPGVPLPATVHVVIGFGISYLVYKTTTKKHTIT